MSSLHSFVRTVFVTSLTLLGVSGLPGHAEEQPAKGALVELRRGDALEKLTSMKGVVLVDLFADW